MSLHPFVFTVEDQRDWQRKPGCSANPFSCFFCHLLSVLGVRSVLDLTYGLGSFYVKCRKSLTIIGVDIRRWAWLVEPDSFHQSDAYEFIRSFNNRVDAVVLDPPYPTKPVDRHGDTYEVLYFGGMPLHEIVEVIKAARPRAGYVILKYMPLGNEDLIKLLSLNPREVVTWRYMISRVKATGDNKFISSTY